ncbi:MULTISPECIES: hypothetical protein [Anaerotruncus]|jgi:hypothetical protein|uniref:Uncharacterized protein n=1 Tax=Anaerotruncus colihominis TaxID=169435 RepID=A0A845SVF8_9FIRM|nr:MULTISPECIES: hypothetical protein [Anaerotruncus]MCI8492354.1 hypothetical protein [Anaerotruncus sp.]MCR2026279.1 hypothetical protein [Anaerotruncus colihominis]NDO38888.1 hypothetical protein [Anaerotruncus colihominis]
MKKRVLAVCTALILAIALGIFVNATGNNLYSVSVSGKNISFVLGGRVVGTYQASSTDLKLMTDGEGDLLVCFHAADGRYLGVTLGKQTSVTIQGVMSSLTVDSSLNKGVQVVVGSSGSAGTMYVYSPVSVVIQGNVGTLDVATSAQISLSDGAYVTKARVDSSATLNIPSRSSVGNLDEVERDSYTSSSSSGNLKFRTRTIYANSGDRLRDLVDELADNVTAYYNDRKISGDVEWVTSESTTVRNNRYYRFRFIPDSSKYDDATGTIRVRVDGDDSDENVYLKIDEIYADKGDRLRDLLRDLRSNVTAYNDNDDEISGDFEWVESASTRVEDGEKYKFRFIPDSSRYERVTDYITIYVD